MQNELRPILLTAMSPRRCKRLTGVNLVLSSRFRSAIHSANRSRSDHYCPQNWSERRAAVSAFQLKWIPSQMAARLYTHRHQANGHWRGQSVGSSVIPKTFTDFAFQYLSTGVAPFYTNLLATPCQSGFVRRLHRYLGEVRLLGLVHHRLRFLTFPTRTGSTLPAKPKISRFPYKERPHMPGSTTTPDPPSARIARSFVLLSMMMTMSAPGTTFSFAAQYLAYAYPCQRFAETLTGDRA